MEYVTVFIASSAILSILFRIIKYFKNKSREYDMIKNCLGPKAYPIVGNINLFIGDVKDITYNLIKSTKIYSSPWKLWIGPKLFLILDDPNNFEILSKSSIGYEKSCVYEFVKCITGNGLFTTTKSLWKIHRKILDPKFHDKMVSYYMESMNENSNRLINILENTNGGNVDFSHFVHLCTLDIIFCSLMEFDLNLQNRPNCKLPEQINEMLEIITERFFKFWLHPNIIFNNSSLGKRLNKNLAYINNITEEIIRKKKKSLQEEIYTCEEDGPYTNKVKHESPFLDALFKSFYETGEYSEENIHDEINTFILAGTDTSAGTLTFLFLMLASFPEIQNEVYKELYDMYGSNNANDYPIRHDDIKNMKYLERVIKEALRLFPPAPLIGRKIPNDTKVNDNFVVPKNTEVIFSIYSIHRKDNYWIDPLRFNPDRFLPGNYDPKCFIPFSSGKRGCIGQTFAMTQIKTIAASILRKFTVKIDNPVSIENVGLKFSVTLKPAETILLRFIRR